jgi:hypothetical protein
MNLNNSSLVVLTFSISELATASVIAKASISNCGLGTLSAVPFRFANALLAKLSDRITPIVSISVDGGNGGRSLYGSFGSKSGTERANR